MIRRALTHPGRAAATTPFALLVPLALFALLALLALLTPCVACAQSRETGPPTANDVFERAKALLKAGDWVGACAKFQQSFDLEASVSALVKIARCREHEGKPASALAEYARALDLNRAVTQAPARVRELEDVVRAEVAALESSVPRLRLVVSPRPSALEVLVDGHSVPPAELDAPRAVDPGERGIVVRAPGYREERVRVTVLAGASREVRVALHETEHEAFGATSPGRRELAAPQTSESLPGARTGWGAQRVLGLAMGSAGIATLIGAGYFAYRTSALVGDSRSYCTSDASQCDSPGLNLLSDARQAQTVAIVLAGTGATLTGVGLVLYLTSHPSTGGGGTKAALSGTVGPRGAFMRVTW